MAELNEAYGEHLAKIADAIQESEEFAAFLDTEEIDEYKALQEAFEPHIEELYNAVAATDPLQLMALEKAMLHEDLVGLYLPKVLGFAVLRGQVTDNYKYLRSQEHFRSILDFICNSPNFDVLKTRIGQSVQIGFALSSDIYVTGFIESIANKRVRWYLLNQKLSELRDVNQRRASFVRYKRQFNSYNFLSTEFPEKATDIKLLFGMLRDFIIHRAKNDFDDGTIYYPITEMLMREDLQGTPEHTYLMGLFLNFFPMNEDYLKIFRPILNGLRENNKDFSEQYFDFLMDMHERKTPALNIDADRRFIEVLDLNIEDDIKELYTTLRSVHDRGYIHEEVQADVKRYHESHEGLSTENEAIRRSILAYIRQLMENLEPEDYPTWFEMHPVFASYMKIFGNEEFNQSIKGIYLRFLRKCMKRYTDKRGGDYQGVKKFTTATFKECKFMKDKDIKDLFKTKRKKKPTPAK